MKYIELNNEIINNDNETGFYKLEFDKLAIIDYKENFLKNKFMNFKTNKEKWIYLIDNKYYIDFLSWYDEDDFFELIELVKSKSFEFTSFMSISKFYSDYALKSRDKKYILEDYEDRVLCVAFYLGNKDLNRVKEFVKVLINQEYQPATPTFLNAGKYNCGELVSCFLLDTQDSINSINYSLSSAMQLSKIGGGVAINLSKLRSRGSYIRNIENIGKGVIPVMKLFEDIFKYADQLGQRKGAGAIYLNIFHQDVFDFLDTKKINADENIRIQTLSLGLIVPTKFFELTRDNEKIALFDPKNIYDQIGKTIDDIDFDNEYDDLIENVNIKKKYYDSRKLLIKIAQSQFESGYPYIIYKSNVNINNPLKKIGKINMSNLCTEIFQIQSESNVKSYGEISEFGDDICCNLGSINIVNVMEHKNLKTVVSTAIKMLDQVSEFSNIEQVQTIKNANEKYHSIGLGVMNLAGYFAKNEILYDSMEAKEFVSIFFMMLNYYSLVASNEIARQKGTSFHNFDKSDYADGSYFDYYKNLDFTIMSEKMKKLFSEQEIPSRENWINLEKNVRKYGLFHAYRLAIAPTQSISYIQNATPSIMPITELIEQRVYKNSITYYPMPFLDKQTRNYYQEAWYIDQKKVIDLISIIQKHVDQGISCVLHVTSDANVKDLVKLYTYAMKKGLKSLYYTRTKNLTIEECLSCSI